MVRRNFRFSVWLGAAAAVVAIGPSVGQETAPPVRVKIASSYVSANGCHDTTQSFTAQIPNAERLDRTFHGVLDGIEVVETAANNTHAYRNFAFVDGNRSVSLPPVDHQAPGQDDERWRPASPCGAPMWCQYAFGEPLSEDLAATQNRIAAEATSDHQELDDPT